MLQARKQHLEGTEAGCAPALGAPLGYGGYENGQEAGWT